MRHFTILAALALAVVLLTPLTGTAQGKFKNVDTAKDRRTNTFGTRPSEDETPVTQFGTNDAGDSTIDSHQPTQEEVDWYDKVIISVDPQVKWPSSSTTTSTTESTDSSGNTSSSTTTTTTE